jgi:peptide/nickel transport system substrate-binding protein
MAHRCSGKPATLAFIFVLVVLISTLAWGGGEATPQPKPTAAPIPRTAPQTATPVAGTTAATPLPLATPAQAAALKPWEAYLKQGKHGGVLQMGIFYELDHWDLHQACCNRSLYNARDLFNTLVMYDPTDPVTIIGDLAKSWEWAKDGKSITFHLWENAKWSDGVPVTAEDVVFSLDRMTDPHKSRPRVRNLAPYYASSEAIDSHTVKVHTKFPHPAALLPFLAVDYMVIMPKHVLEGRADAETFFDTPENIVGSGSMLFVKHERGSSIEVKRNPHYFKTGLPFLDGVKAYVISEKSRMMTAMLTGQIDFFAGGAFTAKEADDFKAQLGKKGGVVTYSNPTAGFRFIEFNFKNPPVDNPKVRRAIHLALDGKEFIETICLGRGKQGVPFYPGTQWSAPDEAIATWPGFRYVDKDGKLFMGDPVKVEGLHKDPRDLEEARKLLAEAGFANGLTLEYHVISVLKEEALVVQQQLKKIGVKLHLKVTDTTTGFNAEQQGDYKHIIHLGHGPNITDPDDLFLGVYLPGGPRNPLKYEDPRIREIFDRQKSQTDPVKRRAMVKEAEDILRTGEGHLHILAWIAADNFSLSKRVKNFVSPPGFQTGWSKEHIWLEK